MSAWAEPCIKLGSVLGNRSCKQIIRKLLTGFADLAFLFTAIPIKSCGSLRQDINHIYKQLDIKIYKQLI